MPFIVISARKTKYNLLGHIGIYLYNKGNAIIIITNLYNTLCANHCSKCIPCLVQSL